MKQTLLFSEMSVKMHKNRFNIFNFYHMLVLVQSVISNQIKTSLGTSLLLFTKIDVFLADSNDRSPLPIEK